MNDLDQLFQELRQTEPYLPDTGFTAAVIVQLPRRNELPLWIKNLLLLAATAAGSAVVAWQLPAAELLSFMASSTLTPQFLGAATIAVYLFSYAAVWVSQQSGV